MAELRAKAYALAAAVFTLDRATKTLVQRNISDLDTIPVIPGLLNLVNSQNQGVVFGIFNDSTSTLRAILLAALAAVAVIFIASILWRPERLDRLSVFGLALAMSGAAGNGIDRALRGSVTDFLDFYTGEHHWHTFNVADCALVGGCALLLLSMWRTRNVSQRGHAH